MRRLFLFMMVSLDGYMEGENHDISWHSVDAEFNDFAAKQMEEMGAIFLGHRTYDLMHSYWPTAQTEDPADAKVAKLMHTLPKYVFSKTLRALEEDNWKNLHLVKDNIVQIVSGLKKENGKNIAVLGSNNLCVTLLKENLLDELRIMLNPVVIGKGTPLFAGIQERKKFALKKVRHFVNGNVLLSYSILT